MTEVGKAQAGRWRQASGGFGVAAHLRLSGHGSAVVVRR